MAIVGYRTYPTTDINGQIEDIVAGMKHLRTNYPQYTAVTLAGHSSGAHIALLSIVDQMVSVDRWIGIAGVYNIAEHYRYERCRGVERLSPMSVAPGGSLAQWKAQSITQRVIKDSLPPLLFVHGANDTTVPYTASASMAARLPSAELRVLPETKHVQTALELMFGGGTTDAVLDWIARDTED